MESQLKAVRKMKTRNIYYFASPAILPFILLFLNYGFADQLGIARISESYPAIATILTIIYLAGLVNLGALFLINKLINSPIRTCFTYTAIISFMIMLYCRDSLLTNKLFETVRLSFFLFLTFLSCSAPTIIAFLVGANRPSPG